VLNKLTLTVACHGYDRVQALRDGTVQADGIDLRMITLPIEEIFWRQIRHREFDASELSMSAYLIGRSRGDLPFIAIPVFPSRFFRHSCIYVNPARGITQPTDLVGKRIGVPEYHLTAVLWIRGMLAEDYGVTPNQILWFTGGLENPGREEKFKLQLPDVHMEAIPPHRTLNEMLESGELDGYMGPRQPRGFRRAEPTLVRLFPDYEQVEMEYYRRTGIFPIMHVVAIQEELCLREPWVAMSLYKAFVAAKDYALREMDNTGALQYALPWMWPSLERTRALMGWDIWPYGVEANRVTLEKMLEYSYQQGLSRRRLSVEEIFAPGTLDEFKI